MGRYKSVLKAESDARRFQNTVDVPVPPNGLGSRMDEMEHWLRTNAKCEWATHGVSSRGVHCAHYYFESPWDAHRFGQEFGLEAGPS